MTKSVVIIIIILVVAIGIAALLGTSGARSGTALDPFAQCLAAKNVTMYGAYSCSHCQNQKAMFGSSFKYVPYVECTQETEKCLTAKVEGVPTWMLPDGRQLVGEQPLERLAQVSGCTLPGTK
ncbi:hypothetical protein COU12_02675 [Candidatus Jorgensenbacteria bacterium CG10_big_fil_rev_8_21_14_0_10_54_38]|uniref:Thioredoxin domain-containing protein n=2 Tax=Candidatus Joergenseniibacteriota TaxID=1752739 RepID=A0A2M6WFF1_9BACT|nr:MAG: hypothetical protein COX26_02575 [Candidatus Jorgensenbacteria bacterium CG23_combo_of_CG06-09_8_20_14_all_54_14]PIT91518.1 MAG: hypothetical protein COU12_02675 [Candidatus Jorgensenbacteria bacterium CG10_big_fil_rev_8_21_14_0_10_54_38]